MAYTDPQPHSHARIAGVTGVALIHVALAFGLATGLTIKYFDPPETENIEGTTVTLPPPPLPADPPPEQPQPRQEDPAYTPPVAPVPPLNIPRDNRTEVTVNLPPTNDVIVRVPPIPIPAPPSPPPPPPRPAFDARGPVPTNGPAGWITADEYPGRSLQREEEGTASYAVEVGTNGRVTECRITSGTGHRLLDEATCDWVKRRARFDAAIDTTGAKVAGTYRGQVTWQIPRR